MDVRVPTAVLAARFAAWGSRRLAKRGATALPGLVAERVHPRLLSHFGSQLGRGSVLVTGTNGKTTTARFLASIFEAAGVPFVHNREGSNLTRGIASALLARSNLMGKLSPGEGAAGLFETDEATLPRAAALLAPRAVAFTNLFRDQLDRYGEVEAVAGLWRRALTVTPPGATLVLCADDPSVAELAWEWQGRVHWFGIEDERQASADAAASDARWCRACGAAFDYDRRFFAHVGHWRCSGCGRERPQPDTSATHVTMGLDGASLEIPGLGHVQLKLTGLYNVWNALAAAAVARVLGIADTGIRAGLEATKPAFGRQERIEAEGRVLRLYLVKNPAGANQVLQLLGSLGKRLAVAVLLNDRFADGRDPSWIWDVEFERLTDYVERCWVGGDRAEDMGLRLVYAGWREPSAVTRGPEELWHAVLDDTKPGDEVFVLATYTAMLDVRELLARKGYAPDWW